MENNTYNNTVKLYYTEKQKYDKKIDKILLDIHVSHKNNPMTIKQKREYFSKYKNTIPCFNCKRNVGNIFNNNNRKLSVICGSIDNPCGLDIDIYTGKYTTKTKDLIHWKDNVEADKVNIVKTKLDLLFNFITEEQAVEKFEKLKSYLKESMENYDQAFTDLYKVTHPNNKDILNNLIIKKREHIDSINKYLELYKINKDTPNSFQYIKDAVNIYNNELLKVIKDYNDIKYKCITIDSTYLNKDITNRDKYNDDVKILKLSKYNINDLEDAIENPTINKCMIGYPNAVTCNI